MKPILWIINGIISSLIFIFLVSFSFNFFDMFMILILWVMFVLPVFLIGGSTTLAVVFYLQKKYQSMSYFPSLIVFIFSGIICNVFALLDLARNGWNEGVLQYLILGIAGSLIYFHMWLLLNKATALIKAKLPMNKINFLWKSGINVFIVVVIIAFILNLNRAQENMKLEQVIHSIVEDKNNSQFNLNPLTDFSWDKAQLFGPYTTKEIIEESLGVSYDGQTGGIDYREDIFLLVFLHEDKVVQYAILDRQGAVNFSGKKAITPSDDLIKIERTH
ncbi:hypothetical protein F7731_15045 [Cytobacillus depressus]|uniref:Uncharacterized protein n=1 Tax=Cytobacillus depressus TaxID=1602942 RepID=A0A6L3V4Y3_9BACI|nr:hypothetical protein [Cytobacillus depressus]KAB2334522.1 hypothetical protein F7731_15045 [Cytobacillus depressus]